MTQQPSKPIISLYDILVGGISLVVIGFSLSYCSQVLSGPPSPSDGWAERGDNLVKQRDYAGAYAAYMSRCNDPSGSRNMRMAGCETARELRLKAKRYGVDTSNW